MHEKEKYSNSRWVRIKYLAVLRSNTFHPLPPPIFFNYHFLLSLSTHPHKILFVQLAYHFTIYFTNQHNQEQTKTETLYENETSGKKPIFTSTNEWTWCKTIRARNWKHWKVHFPIQSVFPYFTTISLPQPQHVWRRTHFAHLFHELARQNDCVQAKAAISIIKIERTCKCISIFHNLNSSECAFGDASSYSSSFRQQQAICEYLRVKLESRTLCVMNNFFLPCTHCEMNPFLLSFVVVVDDL